MRVSGLCVAMHQELHCFLINDAWHLDLMQGILIGEPERGFVRLIKVAPMHPGDELFYASEI